VNNSIQCNYQLYQHYQN